jgi:inner membrane transporter RhtA
VKAFEPRALVVRARPEVYFATTAAAQSLGPGLSVALFAQAGPLAVAWLRIATAAIFFAIWRRPWGLFSGISATQRKQLVLLGAVLALMNSCFYMALHYLPMGIVSTIELVPITVLAAFGARTARSRLTLALSIVGGILASCTEIAGNGFGLVFAVVNAIMFALYITISSKLARGPSMLGLDGLACAMAIALVVAAPTAAPSVIASITRPAVVLGGIAVGLITSVIAYVSDQLTLRKISPATYGLLFPLRLAIVTIIGLVIFGQHLTPLQVAGIMLVVIAIRLISVEGVVAA